MNTPTITDSPEAVAAGSSPATGSLPASSVQKLLERWEAYLLDWKKSEESWRENMKSEGDLVRLNRCQARIKTWQTAIEELRAETAATSVRQPVENNKVSYHADNAGGAHEKDTNDK